MIMETIENRRSIRKYKNTPVPREILDEIINAGRLAPSGKNKQPWMFLVYGGQEKDKLLDQMDKGIQRESGANPLLPRSGYGLSDARNTLRVMKEAPVIIVILNSHGKSPFESLTVDERFTEIVDTLSIGAAIQNMLLQAEEQGLGTLWITNTCFAYPELSACIGTEHQLIGAIALGYGAENPPQRPRKGMEDIVEYRM